MRFRTLTIILTLFYFVGMATIYHRAVPIFESSDEAEHFLYIHSILQDGSLPVIQSRDNITFDDSPAEIWNNHVHHAPLYYLIGAGLISWSDRSDIDHYLQPNEVIFVRGLTTNNPNKWLHSPYVSDGDTAQAVYILRIMNTLLGVLTLCMVYVGARRAWGREGLALSAMVLVASIPSFISVHASVTNDALVIFFYSAGTLWLVHVWQKAALNSRDMLMISLIVVGASLAKLTGASLAVVVGLALLFGAWRGRFRFADVVKTGVMMTVAFIVLAGWWYIRNYQLYGDFFALSATQSLWGREFDLTDAYNGGLMAELDRIGRSFWLMIGYRHAPLLATDWLLGYGVLIIVGGLLGAVRGLASKSRDLIIILLMVCSVVIVMLIIGTRNVDISYGRILFPALPALALLVVWGLSQWVGRWGVGVMLVPLIVMTVLSPRQIWNNYPLLTVLTPNDRAVDGLVFEHVEVKQTTVFAEERLDFELTFAGMDADNPYLLATAVDSITQERLGHTEVYAGSAPTHGLKPDGRYQTWVSIPIDPNEQVLAPRMVDVYLRWSNASQSIRHDGAVWVDPDYQAPAFDVSRQIVFGDVIQLDGYQIQVLDQTILLDLWWQALDTIQEDWVLTVQLLDQTGELIAQTDGLPMGYPPSRWVEGIMFVDQRVLSWDEELLSDRYDLMLAWYRLADGERLPITSETAINQIILLESVYITP